MAGAREAFTAAALAYEAYTRKYGLWVSDESKRLKGEMARAYDEWITARGV